MNMRLTIGSMMVLAMVIASPTWAYLGSFEQADGYHFLNDGIPDNWIDVTNYNAGAHGANAGGGASAAIAPNSGLWKINSNNGAFFPTTALRNAWTGSAPPYPITGSIPAGTTVGAYVIGDHPGGRTGDALGLRNYTPAGTGPIMYDYTIDSYDYGGVAPPTVTSGPISVGFWFWPSNPDPSTVPPQDKFILSFIDSGGNIGFQWGYARDNQMYWRPGSSGAWNMTGLFANDPSFYDGLTVDINLTAQTFKIDYFDFSTSITTTLAPTQALGASMSDLTHLGWYLTDNVMAGPGGWGGKNFFDDFKFSVVPEPSSALVMLAAGAVAAIKRPRRQRRTSVHPVADDGRK